MSWRDCISQAATSGRITQAKAEVAEAEFDAAFERAIAAGEPEGQAMLLAADAAVESITALNKAKRWQRINEMQRSFELDTRIRGAKDISTELDEIMIDLELSYDSTMGFSFARLEQLLEGFRPKKAGLMIPTEGLDDVARAAYGDVRSPAAKEMADAIKDTMELLRQWANKLGASIPDNPNRHLFQTHDAVKLDAVDRSVWVNDHLAEGVLDWEVMRYAGKKIEPGERQAVLERTYDAIVSDGNSRGHTAQGEQASLANRLNRDRFLYYKDGEAWIAMQKKYGAGTLYEQTVGMIEAMSRDIALLRVFGPSAHAAKEFVKRVALNEAAERGMSRASQQKVSRQTAVFEDMYKIHSLHTPSLEGNWPIQTFAAVRNMAVNALLGGVFVPSLFGDLANMKAAKSLLNMPTNSSFQRYWKEFIPSKQSRAEAIRGGVIFESAISLAQSRVRYFGLMDGPMWTRRIGDFTYRASLASHHTQVARNASGKEFMGILGDHVGKSFDDLPFAPFLVERGITPADWNAMRVIPLHDVRGAKFLRPIDAPLEVGSKFANAMQLYIKTAVPDVSLRSRRALGAAMDPNQPGAQAWKTMMSLTSFPVAIYFNQLRRIGQAQGPWNKMKLMASYFAWMTLGGMFITQTKAVVLNGQNPYEMLPRDEQGNFDLADPRYLDFFGRSVVNGGSLGILGDTIFNNLNISNTGYRPGNPTEEYLKSLHRLTLDNAIDAASGEPELSIGKDAKDFLSKNVPDFWYLKLVSERYIFDELQRESDPAAYARRQKWEQEHEEGSWLGIGE